MQKTNFQCMYLIDQALYNKKIIKSDDVISSKFEQHTPSTHSNSASVHNLISQTPYTIKDNIGKERIYPEKIINSVEKVSDSIENPTLTTDHKNKEKCQYLKVAKIIPRYLVHLLYNKFDTFYCATFFP